MVDIDIYYLLTLNIYSTVVQGHGRLSRMGDLSRGASLESLNRLSLSTPDLTKSSSFFRSPSPSLSSQADMSAMFDKACIFTFRCCYYGFLSMKLKVAHATITMTMETI